MNMQMILGRPPTPEAMDKLDFLQTVDCPHPAPRHSGIRIPGLWAAVHRDHADDQSGPVLQIASDIAPDPYSAEGTTMRSAAHAVIQASHDSPSCRLMVSRQRRIFCVGRARLDSTFTPTSLLTAAVELVLEARPYLTVLRDILPSWQKANA